jgi:glyoxylase-like metal-dependent hydrolase (beta-lactamase superfamily II)
MTLGYKVFFSKRPGVGRDTPASNDHLKWVPTTSTLICSERDAILVDTQLTKAAGRDLVDWVVDTGKNLTTIYITHAHGDHFYGNAALIERFPEAKILPTPEVVGKMADAILPDGMDVFLEETFPRRNTREIGDSCCSQRGSLYAGRGEACGGQNRAH